MNRHQSPEQRAPSGPQRMSGLTLAELLATLAVAAILASLAGPAFGGLLLDARLAATSHQLAHAINHARGEAVRRGLAVTLCGAGAACSGWDQGWQLRLPESQASGESVLLAAALPPGIRLTANRSSFTLRPFGQRATNGTLLLCDRRGRGHAVIVSVTGRARIAPSPANLQCQA